MSLLGQGAVAIWHDIAPQGLEEFYAWHGHEHMPERLAIPGFLRGRRYAAIDADLGFFNLYETTDASVLTGADYRRRLNSPTPLTLAAVKHFSNVARALARVAWSRGTVMGGSIATWRYDVHPGCEDAHAQLLGEGPLAALMDKPGISGAHILVADEAASSEINAEQRARGAANAVPRVAVLVEGWADPEPLAALLAAALPRSTLEDLGAIDPAPAGLYRLQAALTRP